MPSHVFVPLIAGVALALKVVAAKEGPSDFQVSCATTVNCKTTQTVTSTVPPQTFTTTVPGTDAPTVTVTTTTTLPAPPTTGRPGQPPAVTKTTTTTVPGRTTTETTTETTTTSVPGPPPTSCPPTRVTETTTVTETPTKTQTQTPTGCPTCEPCPPCPTDSRSDSEGRCSVPVEDWQHLQLEWNAKFSKPGQPEPTMLTSSYEFPTILEITDDLVSGEQYTVYLGSKKLGKTSDPAHIGSDTCGQDAEKCIKEGYSHGSFQIPAGAQFITISWHDADQEASFGSGQYRFSRETPCDE